MADPLTARRRWFRPTPDRIVLGLLAVEGFLLLSEWFQWFAFNHHKGWTVVICLATVGAAFVLMFLWFLAALAFRLRFQFSILSLFVLTVVVAVACSWLAVARKQARKQEEVVKDILAAGGWVAYDYQRDPDGFEIPGAKPPEPAWLRKVLGSDLFDTVTGVYLTGAEVGDAWLQHLEGLTQLRGLCLSDTKVSDAGLDHLKGRAQLEWLYLDGTKVGDAGMQNLDGLTRLRGLSLGGTRVSDAGLDHLKGLPQLQELYLSGTKITDAGLARLKGSSQLRTLDLHNTEVSDAGLEHLQGLTQLQSLRLWQTHVSRAGLLRCQRALPHCELDEIPHLYQMRY